MLHLKCLLALLYGRQIAAHYSISLLFASTRFGKKYHGDAGPLPPALEERFICWRSKWFETFGVRCWWLIVLSLSLVFNCRWWLWQRLSTRSLDSNVLLHVQPKASAGTGLFPSLCVSLPDTKIICFKLNSFRTTTEQNAHLCSLLCFVLCDCRGFE